LPWLTQVRQTSRTKAKLAGSGFGPDPLSSRWPPTRYRAGPLFFHDAVRRLVQTIATFDDFFAAIDPHGEHDFGGIEFDGVQVFFKIDYYDKDLTFHSPDPADPAVTEQIITIMLAEEY
jgi:hypothetical protein